MRSLQEISGAPLNGIRRVQLASACLREAASAKAGAFLSSLRNNHFFSNGESSPASPSLLAGERGGEGEHIL
jgi:hypothetical protein